jgi:hypothetical protein
MRIERLSSRPVARAGLLLAVLLATPVSVRGDEPLAIVREAFRASSTGLESGSGKGVYRVYESIDGGDWFITTDADIASHFDGAKYFVELRFHPELRGVSCRRIMYDGRSLRTAWFSPGMLTRGQVEEINWQDHGDGLIRPESEFPWDVSKLASNAWNIELVIKNVGKAKMEITRTLEGDLVGSYSIGDPDRIHYRFECPNRAGFNVTKVQVFNDRENRPKAEFRLEWKQTPNGLWYVRSLQHDFEHRNELKRFRRVIKYTEFEPNEKVNADVFTKAFLEMPLGGSDHR